MVDLAIVNGTVVVPGEEPRLAELAIDAGRVSAIHHPGTDISADDHIDASGLHVFPGAIDPHIHLGGYQPLAIDTEPGTGLAALGGVTTLVNYFKATGSYLDLVPEYIETYEDGESACSPVSRHKKKRCYASFLQASRNSRKHSPPPASNSWYNACA